MYSQTEDRILESGDENYLEYHKQLCDWMNETDQVLSEVEKALNDLDILLDQYNLVSNNTNALHNACQQILQDQVRIFIAEGN